MKLIPLLLAGVVVTAARAEAPAAAPPMPSPASPQAATPGAKVGVMRNLKDARFAPLPALPSCVSTSVEQGDPSKGEAVFAIKAPAGCTVPAHWHTADEHLVFVSGAGKMAMRDDATTESLQPGAYVFLPARHVHELTFTQPTTLFVKTEGPFDIHYVDPQGKEIPLDQAVKAAGTKAGRGS